MIMTVNTRLKTELPYDPAIALQGIYPKDTKMLIQRGNMQPNVYSSAINNSQIIKRTQMSIIWWMDKDVLYIYNGILLDNKKEWNLAIWNNVDGTRMYYAKWDKSVRERQIHMTSLICRI